MVRSLFYVVILLLLYFIVQFIFFPTPPKLLAKQICIAPSGCKIEMDTGFCPKCIFEKDEPIIKEEKVVVEKKPIVKIPPKKKPSQKVSQSKDRKPITRERNWVGTLFECIVGCKENVKYWDEGNNEYDKNLNLLSTN
mgnify:CR=1 FL=1